MVKTMRGRWATAAMAMALVGTLFQSVLVGTVSAGAAAGDPVGVARSFYATMGTNDYTDAARLVDPTSDLRDNVLGLRRENWRALTTRSYELVQFTTVASDGNTAKVVVTGPVMHTTTDGRQFEFWVYAETNLVEKGGRWLITAASDY